MEKRRFAADGNVRGRCAHEHRSIRTAAACALADLRAVGTSDRTVVVVQGSALDEREMRLIDHLMNEEG